MENLKTKAGTVFEIKRPAFIAGTEAKTKPYTGPENISELNRRNGSGNRNLQRNNFEQSKILPRIAGDFDKLQALDIETQGIKVQLSDKTLAALFKIKSPDPTDTTWLAEKARLEGVYRARGMTPEQIKRELEINKPLGREQRTIDKTENIAQSSLTMADKINEVHQEIKEGRVESRNDQRLLIRELSKILIDTKAIKNLTKMELKNLAESFDRLNVPPSYTELGLKSRYIDGDYYKKEKGMINVHMLANVKNDPNKPTISYDNPVYNSDGINCITLDTMKQYLYNRDVVLDLALRKITDYADVITFADDEKIDLTDTDYFDFSPKTIKKIEDQKKIMAKSSSSKSSSSSSSSKGSKSSSSGKVGSP